MTWHETQDVEQWLAAAGDLLFPDPAEHTNALTVCENVRAKPDGTVFAYWQEADHEVTGAVLHAPNHPVQLCVVPDDAVRPLTRLWQLRSVSGPTALAVQVAVVAGASRGVTVIRAERLFHLAELATPEVTGGSRLATEDDIGLLEELFQSFVLEAGVQHADVQDVVRDRMTFEGLVVWEDAGVPVAVAGHSRKAFGGVRVGPVYTSPAFRGRGYGAAVAAAAARHAREIGAREVVVFADLTNPTGLALYPRLGFEPLSDHVVLELS